MIGHEYFEKIASQWDKIRQGFFSTKVREKALATANIQPGKTAVDLGAGTGFITEGLLENGLKVIAVDQSEAMIIVMKKKFEKFNSIGYKVGEAENLPIQDASVNYVFSNMYLHHVESPIKAIKEMVRILKTGGQVIITDLDEHKFEFLKTEQHDRWMGFKREDVENWFNEAGLKNVKTGCLDENCSAESELGCDKASINIFIASGEK